MVKKSSTKEKIVEINQSVSGAPTARRKGIYLLPNLLTTGALFAGFYAVLSGFSGQYELASIAIFTAMVFDGLDGRVARMTNTQSDFGVQYDSLSDMVSFGVAPAVVAYGWGVSDLGKFGLAAAFVYASCAALRLARFNVQTESADNKVFTGLPSPAAAALIAGFVWSTYHIEPSVGLSVLGAVLTAVAGLLMVSNFKYPSFKQIDMFALQLMNEKFEVKQETEDRLYKFFKKMKKRADEEDNSKYMTKIEGERHEEDGPKE